MALIWALSPCFLGCPFLFSCWCTYFTLGSSSAAPTLPCRFLEGDEGEDTAKIRQADIVEAVDIASAAKVSLGRGPGQARRSGD